MTPPPPPPEAVRPSKGKRRKGLIILGLILIVGGLFGGGAMVAKSMTNYESAVKSLARAPVGCTTTLVFDKPGKFTVYAETKGKLGDLSGDCQANGNDYNHPGDKLPKLSLTLLDSGGKEVDLQRGATASYDVSGYVGTAVRTMQIAAAGTYRLNVESDDTDFAVSIGKNPKKDSDLLKTIGGAVALAGLVLGLLFLLLGLRRRRPAPSTADIRNATGPMPGWPPSPYAPGPYAPSGYEPSPYAPTPTPAAPSFRPQEPVPPPPSFPGQPPIRVAEQAPGGGFAPPSFAPPPPPPPGASQQPSPPVAGWPPAPPAPPPSSAGGGWTVDDDDDEKDRDQP